jgi:Flp pilus assembly protein TadG
MLNLARKTAHRLVSEVRGAEIAEAAAVLPLMFMMLLGIFWFGQAFSIYGTITRAAQEGARAGAAPYCTTCTAVLQPQQNAVNAVQAALTIAKLDPTKAQWPAVQPVLNKCLTGGGAAVCDGSASTNFCVQTPVELSSTVGTGAAGVCGISVTFQYPFQFWLPFTSLNKQQIWLPAAARVRMETR